MLTFQIAGYLTEFTGGRAEVKIEGEAATVGEARCPGPEPARCGIRFTAVKITDDFESFERGGRIDH